MKKASLVLVAIVLTGISLCTVSCSEDDPGDETFYTVGFDAGGGTPVPDAQKVKAGDKAAAPTANPAKEGYAFLFWSLSGTSAAYNFRTPVTADIALRAGWTAESGNNRDIGSAAEWNAAVAAVNAAGDHQTHTFTVTRSFSLPGMGTAGIFAKELSGITVTVRGQGVPVPEISLAAGSRGYLIYLAASQKIVLENIVLKGHAANNTALIGVGYGGSELVIGKDARITENTNSEGHGGIRLSGTVIMRGGGISGNIAGTSADTNGRGGGVYMTDYANLIMESGSISGNLAHGQGGGVCMNYEANFSMKDGRVSGNTARAAGSGARGGGVYNAYGNFSMGGGTVTGYDRAHGDQINVAEHSYTDLSRRDDCNAVVITGTAVGNFGAALYSNGGDNYYGAFDGETFTQTGDFGSIHIERDIEIADGVRINPASLQTCIFTLLGD
jgi:hypothetical protein